MKNQATSTTDAVIVVVNDFGTVIAVRQISLNTQSVNLGTNGFNMLKRFGEHYIFAGSSLGYSTKLQTIIFPNNTAGAIAPYADTMVMKYLFKRPL